MMNRAIKTLGMLLAAIAGGYFIVHAYRSLAGQDLSSLLDARTFAALCLLTVLYATSILTTAAAWSRQLKDMGQPHGFPRFLAILASTQFGKYLPGNVGHHLGRVALAGGSGVRLAAATLSVGYEVLLAIMASAHISAFVLILAPPEALQQSELFGYKWLLLAVISLGALCGLALAPWLAEHLMRLRDKRSGKPDSKQKLRLSFATIVFSYLMYISSLSMVGAGLWIMAQGLADGDVAVPHPLFFIGTFSASWILGLLAPGAPAGLGVREAVLSAWLAQSLPATLVVVLVVALRIATTAGDLLNFAWGSALLVRQNQARKT